MLKVQLTKKFRKDLKKIKRRGFDIKKLDEVVLLLVKEQELPDKYHDHPLKDSRDYKNLRECHIQPDWLLVYEIDAEMLKLLLFRTGTHGDLFNK